MLKVRDIMSKEVVNVWRDTSAEEVLNLLLDHKISGVPVVEDDRTLVGIVTEKDLLKLFYESEDAKERAVEKFMTQPAVHFEEEESIEDILKCLVGLWFRRVPVTRQGKVVGIVSRSDLLRWIRRSVTTKPKA